MNEGQPHQEKHNFDHHLTLRHCFGTESLKLAGDQNPTILT